MTKDDLNKNKSTGDIWVHLEHEDGTSKGVTRELLGKARELAKIRNCEVVAFLAAAACERGLAQEAISLGADRVYQVIAPQLTAEIPESHAGYLTSLLKEKSPWAVLWGATAFGHTLAAQVAVRLETGLTAHCCNLSINEEDILLQEVPAYGGLAVITCPRRRPQMAAVAPGVFSAPPPDPNRKGTPVELHPGDSSAARLRVVKRESRQQEGRQLAGAERVVGIGAGIGCRDNLRLVNELTGALDAALGGTRPAVDEGWVPAENMLGQSGKTIRPQLYVALGISGDMQHMVGVKDAKTVVSVNRDRNAAINKMADIVLVGEIETVVPAVIEALSRNMA